MKKIVAAVLILLAAFFTVVAVTACSTPPPPPPEAPPPDMSPPEVSVTLTPQLFSPDGDGVDDILTVNISVVSASDIGGWSVEIREPEPPYLVFSQWSGEGKPPATFQWDGYSTSGELVQSASDYHFALIVSNQYDNGTYRGTVHVDVLVIRDGDILRVIVPSIVFAPNAGDFKGLDAERMEHNDRILRRIAEVLNKFSTYRVTVEGHANPTTAPGTNQRNQEETRGLYRGDKGNLPLSEERANAVVNYLVNLGVERARLTPIGRGSSRTVVEFSDRDNWWKNRRVEFILEK